MILNQFWHSFLDLLYPPPEACPLCGGRSAGGIICPECLAWLRIYFNGPVCPVCGRFPAGRGKNVNGPMRVINCRFCSHGSPAYDLARAVAPYHGVLREAVLRLKHDGTRRVARALAELMSGAAYREPELVRADLIIPVPLAPKRLAARGFNQAHLLALELGRILDLPVNTKSVIKIKETKPQTGLSSFQRAVNLIDAFDVDSQEKLAGKKVLIVDDVFTTGATAGSIAGVLRRAGTKGIYVLTAAGGIM